VVDRSIAEIVFIGRKCADGEAILAADKVVDAPFNRQDAKDDVALAVKRWSLTFPGSVLPCHARHRKY